MADRRRYETTVILNAALEDKDVENVLGKVEKFIEDHGGEINNVDNWGRRRLAFPINKKFNGCYVHIIFMVAPDILPSFENFLVLEDSILRHLSLQLSDELVEYRKQKELEEGKASDKKKEKAEA